MSDKNNTAFCGLWCGDCIPANERLYELTSELIQLLNDIKFENCAEFKSNRVPAFKDYDAFINVLNSFEKLHCYNYCRKGPCSEAGCAKSCKFRSCAIDKGFDGCWECDTYLHCEHIIKFEEFHPGKIHNLNMIKQYGIDGWKEYRGKHYKWSSERI